MEQLYITKLAINKVRHLKDILIPLSENQIKHLILTGKNGSGKTSVVEALARYLDKIFAGERENAFRNCQKNWLYDLIKRLKIFPNWQINTIIF